MYSQRPHLSLARTLFLSLCLVQTIIATVIATYSDTECEIILRSVTASNGYPNGECTELRSITSTFGSFEVLTEDLGCTVTIYGAGSDPCPSTGAIELGNISTCYNSSWIYFSVDECISSSSSAAASSTLPSSTTASTAPPSTTSTSSSSSSSGGGGGGGGSSSSTDIGAIAGGVVGGVVGLALVVVLAWFLFSRYGRRSRNDDTNINNDQLQLQPRNNDDNKNMIGLVGLGGLNQDKGNDNRTKYDHSRTQELSPSADGPSEMGSYDLDRWRAPAAELP